MLDPAKAGVHCGILVLIGLENVDIRTGLRGNCGGQHRPPLALFSIGQRLDLDHEAIARLGRGRVRLGWTSPTGTVRAASVGHNAIAYRMIAPGAWAATSSALLLALICCQGGFGIRQAGKPLRLDTLGVVCHRLGFLRLGDGIRLGLLLRELTRMHHDKTERFSSNPSVAVLDLDLAHHTLPMPAAGWLILGAPRLL